MGLFGYRFNVPAWFLSVEFEQALTAQGRQLVERTWDGAGAAPQWHDLSDIDAVLCLREDPLGIDLLRKPATKLINSWCAGSIPIVDIREPAYFELVRPGFDALLVSEPRDVISALAQLDDPAVVTRLEEGIRERSEEFSRELVIDAWVRLLNRAAPARTRSDSLALQRLILLARGRAFARRRKRLRNVKHFVKALRG